MRTKLILMLLTVVMLPGITTAQMEGDQWVIGYWSQNDQGYGIMYLDFRNTKLQIIQNPLFKMEIIETASNIAGADGNVLIWTNGMQIMDNTGELIADTIAYDGVEGYWDYFYLPSIQLPFGFPEHDGAIILPVPEHPKEYSIIYHYAESHPTFVFAVTKFLEARVSWSHDTGFELKFKDLPIGPRLEYYTGTVSAVRHANGRDWWVISFREDSPEYYVQLLDPDGIHFDHIGSVDSIVREGLGQAVFSPLGNYFARMDALSQNAGEFITLFQFDRCTGDFQRVSTFHTSEGLFTGVAFSPSEQFLYADDNTHLWQWDLSSDDIKSSQVLVDTFDGFSQPNWGPMRFGPLVNAPDGRIYIVPSAGSSKFLHVIDRPDLPTPDCRFLQHYINLQIWNGRSAPNIPNFRLGPIDGSPCDTLGINNLPVSRWRYEEDEPSNLDLIRFTDLSFFDPQTWHWDFDDGGTSDTPSPLHTFEPGYYHVCLTVSNQYASDSTCHWVEILTTGIKEEQDRILPDVTVSPNPFHDYIMIQSRRGDFRPAHLQLYDMYGRMIFDDASVTIPSKIYLKDYPPGIYLCSISEDNDITYSFKLMKE